MNDDYLDPDRHLWPECHDDVCFHCGYKFPADAEIEGNFPMEEGFCCQECLSNNAEKKTIPCIRPMFKFLCEELGRDTVEGWSKSVYKGTACGAWLTLNSCDEIMLGSIVEGSEVEIEPHYLNWPFTSEQFWGALEAINNEASWYWERDNSQWYRVEFTPVDKPAEAYHLRYCWGEFDWEGVIVPDYVKNKVQDFLINDGELTIDKARGICLGISLTEFYNDTIY